MFEDKTLLELKEIASSTKDCVTLRELLIEVNDRLLIEKSEGNLSTLMSLRQEEIEKLQNIENEVFKDFFDEKKLHKYALFVDGNTDGVRGQRTKEYIMEELLDETDKKTLISKLGEMYSERLGCLFDKLSEFVKLIVNPEWEC